MLTHTGRTYEPGSVHPRRCERENEDGYECLAPATWENRHGERLCQHHNRTKHPDRFKPVGRPRSAPRLLMECYRHGVTEHALYRRHGKAFKRCDMCRQETREKTRSKHKESA